MDRKLALKLVKDLLTQIEVADLRSIEILIRKEWGRRGLKPYVDGDLWHRPASKD